MTETPDTNLDGTYTAVLDRYEGDLAVLVVEADGEDIAETTLNRDKLPEDCRSVDDILEVIFNDGVSTAFVKRDTLTDQRHEEAQDRFDRLSRRRSNDDG
jgi:Protein of unknown function (DUF3006).